MIVDFVSHCVAKVGDWDHMIELLRFISGGHGQKDNYARYF